MRIEMLDIAVVKPYVSNPRNNKGAVEKVASSIREFGFKVPIVVDGEHVVICGHTRLLAAKHLGLKEVPCIIADDLSPDKVRAYRIADNKVSEYSKWEEDILKGELQALLDTDYNLEYTGFSQNDVDDLFKTMESDLGLDVDKGDVSNKKNNILRFGKRKVVMTDEEYSKIQTRYDRYVSDNGTDFGFVSSLLGK